MHHRMLMAFAVILALAAPGTAAGKVKEEAAPPPADGPTFFALPEMVVNLHTARGRSRFLRLVIQVELEKPKDAKHIEAVLPRLMDRLYVYLSGLDPAALRGGEALKTFKKRLRDEMNLAAKPVKLGEVLVQQLLIQ